MMAIKPVLVKGDKFFWVNMGREGTFHTAAGDASPNTMMALGMDLVPDALYPAQLLVPASVQGEESSQITNVKFHLHQSLAETVSLHLMNTLSPGNNNSGDIFNCKAVTAVYICDITEPIHRSLKSMKLLLTSKCGIQVFCALTLNLYIQESQRELGNGCETQIITTFEIASTAVSSTCHQNDLEPDYLKSERLDTQWLHVSGSTPGLSLPIFVGTKLEPTDDTCHSSCRKENQLDENVVKQTFIEASPFNRGNNLNHKGLPEPLEYHIGGITSSITSDHLDVGDIQPWLDSKPCSEDNRSTLESSEKCESMVQANAFDINSYVKIERCEEKMIAVPPSNTAQSDGAETSRASDEQVAGIPGAVGENQVPNSPPYDPDSFDFREEDEEEEEEVIVKERARGLPQRRAARVAAKLVQNKWRIMFEEDSATAAGEIKKKKLKRDDDEFMPDDDYDSNSTSSSSDISENEVYEENKEIQYVVPKHGRCSECFFLHEEPLQENVCFICSPLRTVPNPDPPLRRHSEEESYPDLPEGLKYVTSDVDGNLKTMVVSNKLIHKGSQFGPVVGCTLPYEELDCTACNEEYYWAYFNLETRTATVVDTSDLSKSNWFHFLRGSNTDGNMFQVMKNDTIYLVACNDIAENQEITIKPYSKIFKDNAKAFFTSYQESLHRLSCQLCNIRYDCRLSLSRHLLVFHAKNNRFRTLNCATCGLLIRTHEQFQEHKVIHGGNVNKCDLCGAKFRSPQTLAKHKKTQHVPGSKDSNLCNLCGKTFASRAGVNTHKRKVHRDIKFPCSKCPKVFNIQRNLVRHLNYHNKAYSFTCDRCGKPFVDKTNLDVHMLTHSGRKPFKCTECSCGFTTKQSLQSHYKKKHGYTMESMPEIKRLFPLRENNMKKGELD